MQRKRDTSRKDQYRVVYELLWSGNPRRYIKDIASRLQVDPRTAGTIVREAFDLGYITKPQIRRRSYANMKEYIYIVNCEDPLEAYSKYSEDQDVVYHAVLMGFANLMITSKKEIDVEGNILVEGYRSDYHVAFAPNRSWELATTIMEKKVETFQPGDYEPKGIIKTHWDEQATWGSEDEILFREFKYDLRKPLTTIMRKHLISPTTIYAWLEKLPHCCTVFTRYFPECASIYDPYLFMFKTDYEDFIIDLFSELPTSPFFFKVSDRLFMSACMNRTSLRRVGLDMSGIGQLHIPLLVKRLKNKKILRGETDAIFRYHWRKEL